MVLEHICWGTVVLMHTFVDTGLGAHVCYCTHTCWYTHVAGHHSAGPYMLVLIYVVAHQVLIYMLLDSVVLVYTCVVESHSAGARILWHELHTV